jgi:hypothetical protein
LVGEADGEKEFLSQPSAGQSDEGEVMRESERFGREVLPQIKAFWSLRIEGWRLEVGEGSKDDAGGTAAHSRI